MEELPLHAFAQHFCPLPSFAPYPALPAYTIHGIPDHRMSNVRKVNPNLMRSPRAQRYL